MNLTSATLASLRTEITPMTVAARYEASDHGKATDDTLQADRIKARRAARKMAAEARAAEASALEDLRKAEARFGADAVQSAYLLGLERAEANNVEYAFKWARREAYREARAAVARRRREGELKYADAWAPSDPTGDTATDAGIATILLQADTFAHPCVGRKGVRVDYVGLAAALGVTEAEARVRAAGALHAATAPLEGHSLATRARAVGMSPLNLNVARDLAEYREPRTSRRARPAEVVVTLKAARNIGPAVHRIR